MKFFDFFSYTLAFTLVILSIGDAFLFSSPISNCTKLKPHLPKDINDLAPTSINVIMALGDSITAAFGVMGREGRINEFRGKSYITGGDEEMITVANFIKYYNPNLFGASYGSHLVQLPNEPYLWPQDYGNAAQSGAVASDLLGQLEHLYKVLSKNSSVNIKENWKLLNMLIGANDACPLCMDIIPPSPAKAADAFIEKVAEVIQAAYEMFPRTFFNIVPIFNVSGVYNLSLESKYCERVHEGLPLECPCAFSSSQADRNYLDEVISEYTKRLIKLTEQWQSRKLTDFAVVYQPFSIGLKITDVPIEYLSNLDCFHPSLLAHQKMAIALWNSLITPMAEKKHNFNPDDPLICPDQSSRLWTS
jgi:phospholipase B1